MEFLNNSYCMAPESEGTINHDILPCIAYIEAIYVLMEEYRDMSKTFFVQIVKKWWMGNEILPREKLFFFPLLSNEKVCFFLKIPWQILNNIYWKWGVFNNLWTIRYFFRKNMSKSGKSFDNPLFTQTKSFAFPTLSAIIPALNRHFLQNVIDKGKYASTQVRKASDTLFFDLFFSSPHFLEDFFVSASGP